jgi:peroxin-12
MSGCETVHFPTSLGLQVLSQRSPWLHRVLAYEEEALAVGSLILNWHSLSTADATFAESLYGLCRRRAGAVQPGSAINGPRRILAVTVEVGGLCM